MTTKYTMIETQKAGVPCFTVLKFYPRRSFWEWVFGPVGVETGWVKTGDFTTHDDAYNHIQKMVMADERSIHIRTEEYSETGKYIPPSW